MTVTDADRTCWRWFAQLSRRRQSEGPVDDGRGEVLDQLAVAALGTGRSRRRLWLRRLSFGSWSRCRGRGNCRCSRYQHRPPSACRFTGVMRPLPWLLIQGEKRRNRPAAAAVFDWGEKAQAASPPSCACPTPDTSSIATCSTCRGDQHGGAQTTCRSCALRPSPHHRGGDERVGQPAAIRGLCRGWRPDTGKPTGAQQAALPELDRIHLQFLHPADSMLNGWLPLPRSGGRARAVLWGGVAAARPSWSICCSNRWRACQRRWHFHRFMGEVHARLRALPDTPIRLSVVARDLSADLRLLMAGRVLRRRHRAER